MGAYLGYQVLKRMDEEMAKRILCPNCGKYEWTYYEKYKGHGCGSCGYLFLDSELDEYEKGCEEEIVNNV